jgi:glyoxylase-like metal-dependent hydrolase (beta-lactamase superfamily II)
MLKSFGANEFSDPFGLAAPQNASLSTDAVTALASIEKVKRFDARDDTWVILSHDASLRVATPNSKSKLSSDTITLFPATINGWKKNGWKQSSQFAFLEAGNRANIFANDTGAH